MPDGVPEDAPGFLLDLLTPAPLPPVEALAPRRLMPRSISSTDADEAGRWLEWAMRQTADGRGDDIGYKLAQQLLIAQVADVRTSLLEYADRATVDPRDPFTEGDVRRWIDSAAKSDLVRQGTAATGHSHATSASSPRPTSIASTVQGVHDRSFPLLDADGEDRQHDENGAGSDPSTLTRRRPDGTFPLLGLEQLATLRHSRPEILLAGKIMRRTLNIGYGDSDTGKSYYVQDQCFRLSAAGLPVWYIAAEGFDGFYLRMLAWQAEHPGASLATQRVIPVPVQLFRSGDPKVLAAQALALPEAERPALIVIDTLHRCTDGASENDNADMGCVAATASLWRAELGATTWVVHHEGKDPGKNMRGASCLRNDPDSIQYFFRGGDISVIECEKQKDGITRFEPEAFTLEMRSLTAHSYPGLGAYVVKHLGPEHVAEARRLWKAEQMRKLPGAKNAGEQDPAHLTGEQAKCYQVFEKLFKQTPDGVFRKDWREACEQAGIKPGSFHFLVKQLEQREKVYVPDTTGRYWPADQAPPE